MYINRPHEATSRLTASLPVAYNPLHMIRRRTVLLSLIGLWIWAAVAWAGQNVFVKAQVDQQEVNLGDQVVYTVEVMTAGETQYSPDILLPNFGGQFQVGDIFTRSSISILNGKTFIVNFKEVHLLARRVGKIEIPSSQVELINPHTQERMVEQTNPVILTVNSAAGRKIEATATPQIDVLRPIKRNARLNFSQWWPFALAAMLIMAAVGFMVYLGQRPPQAPALAEPEDTRSPQERAFEKLAEAAQLKVEGKINDYYTRLSSILRTYLSEAYALKAEAGTTREVLDEMSKHHFKEEFIERYQAYALASDEVKYAGVMPNTADVEKAFPEVESMIKASEVQDLPPAPVQEERASEEAEEPLATGAPDPPGTQGR